MKKKKEKFIKQNFIGFIIGGIIFGTLGVYAAITFPSNEVSFDPSNSTLTSTNVKDAIDELYKKCTTSSAGDQIIEDNGLKKDPYECRYFFTGANPNNYVTFNGETAGWRIISVGCDGTIKIMKTANINTSYTLAWDTSASNKWNRPASLNTYLNGDYYNSLTSTAQSQIVEATYYAGAVTYNNNDMQDQISDEKAVTSKVKVALPTLSEYLRANSNKEQCGTFSLNNSKYSTCKNSDWMFNNDLWWTLSPDSGTPSDVFDVTSYGSVYSRIARSTDRAVRPAITLSSEVQITGGIGTESDPYILS